MCFHPKGVEKKSAFIMQWVAKNIEFDPYNIYKKFYDILPNNFLIDNSSIFHPIICAKEMEDENAKRVKF